MKTLPTVELALFLILLILAFAGFLMVYRRRKELNKAEIISAALAYASLAAMDLAFILN